MSHIRPVDALELSLKILESEFEKVQALKAEVGPMQSVKKTDGLSDTIKTSGTKL